MKQANNVSGDRRSGRGRHVVIIGSGFGGLAAAVRLGARGFAVTMLEKRDRPGGRASAFEQDGYRFDAGPSLITWPALLEELWTLAGRRFSDDVTLLPVSPMYRIRFHDGSVFDHHADAEQMRAEVTRLAPGDLPGYLRFIENAGALFQEIEPLMQSAVTSPLDLLRFTPGLLRARAFRSLYGLASLYVRDERLRHALSIHPLFIGGNPFAPASAVYGAIQIIERRDGIHFPVGGTGAIVRGLQRLVQGLGGQLRCSAEVEEIVVKGGRATGVRLSGGETINAELVVSNADAAFTYLKLLAGAARRVWSDERVRRARHSSGLFIWYFGTKKTYADLPQHHLLLGPGYATLANDLRARRHVDPAAFLYLHRPTASDPALAPPGCDAFYVLSPVENLNGTNPGIAGMDWIERGERYRRAIQDRLERTVLPNLGAVLTTSRVVTPADFAGDLLSYRGAAFSFDPTVTQSVFRRPQCKSEDVDGLYLVGAGTHPGAGIPAVLCSAKILDGVID